MKILLFLNGPEGWQTGIEDGFGAAKSAGLVDDTRYFYLDDRVRKHGADAVLSNVRVLLQEFRPDMVVVFHIAGQRIIQPILECIAALRPRPALVYDEGDMYGGLAKPMTPQMRAVMRQADVVSIRGLGPFHRAVSAINPSIVYTPHHADLARYDELPPEWSQRDLELTFIGNRNKPRFLSFIRRLPGAAGRERFVRMMGREFGTRLNLYGDGWQGMTGDRGVLPFDRQMAIYRRSRITVAYEHYPEVSYYFSNRLPMALMSGSLYVCHDHDGYSEVFRGQDFIYCFRNSQEALDIVHYLGTVNPTELQARSARARDFALAHYHPGVVWAQFLRAVQERLDRPRASS